jgi:quercetin dioxygenase-like cupin family protein
MKGIMMKIAKIWDEDENNKEKLLISRDETETIALGYVSVEKGGCTQPGFHDDEEEIYVILKGRAVLTLGAEETETGAGETIYVPRNTKHQMRCISDEKLEYLYFANWPK